MKVECGGRTVPPLTRAAAARVFILFLLLSPFVASCKTAERVPPRALSDEAVTLELPLVHQDALYECGLASISALCQYWGVAIPEPMRIELAKKADEEQGLSGAELCDALDRLGFEAYLFSGTLDRSVTGLYRHVDAGRPPLVMLSSERAPSASNATTGRATGKGHHYCLMLGYDEPRANVILLDPLHGEVLTPVAVFRRDWERCKSFTLLACPREAADTTTKDAATAARHP